MGSSFRLLRFALCGAFFTANVTTSGCDETSPPPDILGTSYELVATIETLEPSSAGDLQQRRGFGPAFLAVLWTKQTEG